MRNNTPLFFGMICLITSNKYRPFSTVNLIVCNTYVSCKLEHKRHKALKKILDFKSYDTDLEITNSDEQGYKRLCMKVVARRYDQYGGFVKKCLVLNLQAESLCNGNHKLRYAKLAAEGALV